MRRASMIAGGLGALLIVAACSGDSGDESSTTQATTTVAPVTSLEPAESTTVTTTTAVPSTTASTTTVVEAVVVLPDYTIVAREDGEGGDTVVVLLDDESYLSLTDIDLANVLADVVDKFPPILTAFVIDNPEAADAVLAAEPTEEQQALLDRHHLVRLEEGFRMVFTGPFSDSPIAILGS